MDQIDILIANISNAIINPLIILMFVVALVVFLWGIVEFMWQADNTTALEKGKQHMFWGVIGMFIMASVYGIIGLIMGTILGL